MGDGFYKLGLFEEKLLYSCEDKLVDFEGLIGLNEDVFDILDGLYVGVLNSKAQVLLNSFELRWFMVLETMDDSVEGYTDSVGDVSIVHSVFQEFRSIELKSRNDLEELLFILRISCILLDDAEENNNLDALWESVYQIERRLRFCKLL